MPRHLVNTFAMLGVIIVGLLASTLVLYFQKADLENELSNEVSLRLNAEADADYADEHAAQMEQALVTCYDAADAGSYMMAAQSAITDGDNQVAEQYYDAAMKIADRYSVEYTIDVFTLCADEFEGAKR